jgi:hypothetical protein
MFFTYLRAAGLEVDITNLGSMTRFIWCIDLILCANPQSFQLIGSQLSAYGVQLSPYELTHTQTAGCLIDLAAAAGAAATHASVAASVSYHDGSAGVAAGGVAHVVHAAHGVGGVVEAAVFHGTRVWSLEFRV